MSYGTPQTKPVGTFRPVGEPAPLALAAGSAIQRAASAAAARIVHHARWPARAEEAHALASKIILGDMRRVICTAVNHECTCGGNRPESGNACPACLVWHRIYSSPNVKDQPTAPAVRADQHSPDHPLSIVAVGL